MRIQSDVIGAPNNSGNSQPVDRGSSQSRFSSESASGDIDVVNLSAANYLLAQAKSLALPSREPKLQSIAAQVRSGTYSTDIGQLTKSLIQDHVRS
ncbi:MAG: flagellar biosynthesis anti-sigma factor FlgM [Acidobacteriaceae bacterium]|nr:flagellar biosynthesis anti-sigma factor FlgM [Acidobacteriaceae bacterium]MBV9500152.1 flagellar biosynthesis anti-sigma factor FlgM [Acidobacteriaceae bacterium]